MVKGQTEQLSEPTWKKEPVVNAETVDRIVITCRRRNTGIEGEVMFVDNK